MALTDDQVRQQTDQAARLTGKQLKAVRYIDLDYWRDQRAPDAEGPRLISDEDEWADPTWGLPSCDSVDFGVELEFTDSSLFSITWESPGPHLEGLRLLDGELIGNGVNPEAATAVWDVGDRSRWAALLGHRVTGVTLHHVPWEREGSEWWLPRLSLHFSDAVIEVFLGEGLPGEPEVRRSATNIAVVFGPSELPSWVDG